jgi:uncharacterized membrane protein
MKSPMKYLFSVAFILSGIAHLVVPSVYLPMMPGYLPAHLLLIYLSGVAEIAGGVGLLIPRFRKAAGWGLIWMLLAFFPVHLHMVWNASDFDFAAWVLYARLPLQVVFIWLIYRCFVQSARNN